MGVLEYWVLKCITPLPHYSNTPALYRSAQYWG